MGCFVVICCVLNCAFLLARVDREACRNISDYLSVFTCTADLSRPVAYMESSQTFASKCFGRAQME